MASRDCGARMPAQALLRRFSAMASTLAFRSVAHGTNNNDASLSAIDSTTNEPTIYRKIIDIIKHGQNSHQPTTAQTHIRGRRDALHAELDTPTSVIAQSHTFRRAIAKVRHSVRTLIKRNNKAFTVPASDEPSTLLFEQCVNGTDVQNVSLGVDARLGIIAPTEHALNSIDHNRIQQDIAHSLPQSMGLNSANNNVCNIYASHPSNTVPPSTQIETVSVGVQVNESGLSTAQETLDNAPSPLIDMHMNSLPILGPGLDENTTAIPLNDLSLHDSSAEQETSGEPTSPSNLEFETQDDIYDESPAEGVAHSPAADKLQIMPFGVNSKKSGYFDINGLPNEVLCAILVAVCRMQPVQMFNNKLQRSHPVFSLQTVCKRWMGLLDSGSTVTQFISLNAGQSLGDMSLADLKWYLRAVERIIETDGEDLDSLSFGLDTYHDNRLGISTFCELVRLIPRTKAATIEIPILEEGEPGNTLGLNLSSIPLSQDHILESLDLQELTWKAHTGISTELPSQLRLPWMSIIEYPSWNRLSCLTLECPLSVTDCYAILQKCSSTLWSATFIDTEMGSAPTLQTLNYVSCSALDKLAIRSSKDFTALLNMVDFPILSTLDLRKNGQLVHPHALRGIHWPKIQQLIFHCDLDPNDILSLCPFLESVTELEWVGGFTAHQFHDTPIPVCMTKLSYLKIVFTFPSLFHPDKPKFERLMKNVLENANMLVSVEIPYLASVLEGATGKNITRLTVASQLTGAKLLSVLRNFPELIEGDFNVTDTTDRIRTQIHQNLQSLKLKCSGRMDDIFNSMQLIALTKLHLYFYPLTVASNECIRFPTFITPKKLHYLTMENFNVSTQSLVSALNKCDNLDTLIIKNNVSYIKDDMVNEFIYPSVRRCHLLCPKLKVLQLGPCDTTDGLVSNVVRIRMQLLAGARQTICSACGVDSTTMNSFNCEFGRYTSNTFDMRILEGFKEDGLSVEMSRNQDIYEEL
ncbi:hypothetical protein BDQ12DRAFT_738120 [Crucibulum laeve]|uniref:F-box domain-containing protein n=1 Tax=Crucibulum laeve TaxID=68775 RepID=A0A5C3LQE7_9AGAR|nr:hypothetical protein BDQ12DRAFT_738120 [Crucibulum laeve]